MRFALELFRLRTGGWRGRSAGPVREERVDLLGLGRRGSPLASTDFRGRAPAGPKGGAVRDVEAGEATVSIDNPSAARGVSMAEGPGRARYARRRLDLALVIAGLLTVLLAAVGLAQTDGHRVDDARLGASSSAAPVVAATASEEMAESITVQTAEYEPGQTSGWHQHQGVHVVAVMSGTLTIHDVGSGVHTYGPGDTYVGGRDVHLARNEGDVPVRMVVIFVLDAPEGAERPLTDIAATRP